MEKMIAEENEQLHSEGTNQIVEVSKEALKSPDKISVGIAKIKRKKTVKYTLLSLQKPISFRQDPIYIYMLIKLMSKYDNDQMKRYSLFGYSDAGVGQIEQISLDKVNETLDLNLETYSIGQLDFGYLIKQYKSYQDQDYYNLSQVLSEYQKWSVKQYKYIYDLLNKPSEQKEPKRQKYDDKQIQIEFIEAAKQWANENFGNEIYDMSIGNVDDKQKRPIFTKKIFSKNFMMLIGQGFEETSQYLIDMNLKNAFCCIFDSFSGSGEQDYNEKLQIQKLIKIMQCIMYSQQKTEVDDEMYTLEGVTIPVKKYTTVHYYNHELKEVNNTPYPNYIILSRYNIEPHWIKYLIDIRSNRSCQYNILPQAQNQLEVQSKIKYFDYFCQQEYFLEKYNYI